MLLSPDLLTDILPDKAAFAAAAVRSGQLMAATSTTEDDRLLPLYSLTKTYIAVLVLRAMERGELDLDETLDRHVADVPNARDISLRQLLNHTAGLPDYGALPEYHQAVASQQPVWTDEDFARHTYRRGALSLPGARFHYANPGYALLVRLLERRTGLPLGRLVNRDILEPLHLTNTILLQTMADPRLVPSRSAALSVNGRALDVGTHYAVGWVWHRLLAATALDAAVFLDALFDGRLLADASLEQMCRGIAVPEAEPPWRKPHYGLGLMCERDAREPAMGHMGGGPGYAASGFFFDRTGISVAVLSNSESSNACYLAARKINQLLAGTPAAEPGWMRQHPNGGLP